MMATLFFFLISCSEDNACTINEALSLIKERQNKNIDVEELFYENGELKSSSEFSLEKM